MTISFYMLCLLSFSLFYTGAINWFEGREFAIRLLLGFASLIVACKVDSLRISKNDKIKSVTISDTSSLKKSNCVDKKETVNSYNLPRYKNKETFKGDYVVFDLETTGFNPVTDNIIEIGAIKYKNDEEVSRFQTYVFCDYISPKITSLTGITAETLSNAPNIKEALISFQNFIGKSITLVAHNASFDANFILSKQKECDLPFFENPVLDTLKFSRKHFKTENHKLHTLKKFLNIDIRGHSSINDCIACNSVYQYCKILENEIK